MLSKYRSIYQHYADLIDQKKLPSGTVLPSESRMMEDFSASRDTVRKAMALLEQGGYINKTRGKESQVIERIRPEPPCNKLLSFTEQMEAEGIAFTTNVEDLSVIMGDEPIMEQMNVDEETEIYRLIRTRRINGERVMFEKDYLLRSAVPKLTRAAAKGSLWTYLEKDLGLKIGSAKKIIQVQPASGEDKLYLELRNDSVVVVVYSYIYLEDGTLFQYSQSRRRIDQFHFEEHLRR